MSRQITLNVSGGMISLSPKDGEKTTIEIVTEKGISYVRNLNTHHDINTPEFVSDVSSSQLDEYNKDNLSDESKRMFGFSKLNSDDIETVDNDKDIVKEMTRDLSEKPATNFNYNHDYTPYNDATLFELDEDDKQKFNLTEEDYDKLIQDYDATYGDNNEETFEDEQPYRSSITDVLTHAASDDENKQHIDNDNDAHVSELDEDDDIADNETKQDVSDEDALSEDNDIIDSENDTSNDEEESEDEDAYTYSPMGVYIEDENEEEVNEDETES